MINIKLLVLLNFFLRILCLPNYCKICPEHVLCQFAASGPGEQCRGYDESAQLTRDEIKAIVDKINERRNSVALGVTANVALPQASNMRTLRWSDELAVFAQRWADQCEPNINPNRQDRCRDMVNMPVGQNVASVLGPTPGLNVKSFVDIWFMQSLHYTGSVSYYNRSRDGSTDYFTQLMWADTHLVGCGKARFYVAGGKLSLIRLVCNFAPGGNVHGRPVYAIGVPATQCPPETAPDTNYTGLCSVTTAINSRLSTTPVTSVSSLLRILNLFNDSVTQEIDPIRIDIKQRSAKLNHTDDRRKPKTRHIYNRTNNAGSQFQVPRIGNPWNPNMSMSRRHDHSDMGDFPVHYGHEFVTLVSSPTTSNTDNYRHNKNECTRKGGHCNEFTTSKCGHTCTTTCAKDACTSTNVCTRGRTRPCCERPDPYPRAACKTHDSCTHLCQTTCCNYDVTCDCFPVSNPCPQSTQCLNHFRRQNYNSNTPLPYSSKSSQDFQYYDLFPNVALRNAEINNDSSFKDDTWQVNHRDNKGYTPKSIFSARHDLKRKKVPDPYMNSEKPLNDGEYFYDTLYPSRKKKRQAEEDTSFKPFWQMGEYQRQPELKALRYTTLSGIMYPQYSEKFTEASDYDTAPSETENGQPVKEKFLSFDELLNLRRNNAIKQLNARRENKNKSDPKLSSKKDTQSQTTKKTVAKTTKKKIKKKIADTPPITTRTTTTTTTQTTTETFPRIRHCTRQLTCTWTAPTVIGEGGEARPVGGPGGGSRTPPGYVEGCTRTSTCTRDYMHRNKLATSSELDGSTPEPTPEDEDYCERRSLNVKRTVADDIPLLPESMQHSIESFSKAPTSPLTLPTHGYRNTYATCEEVNDFQEAEDCVCSADNAKAKRSVAHVSTFTYGDLYYKVLSRIFESWQNSVSSPTACPCNKTHSVFPYRQLILFLIVINLLANKILEIIVLL